MERSPLAPRVCDLLNLVRPRESLLGSGLRTDLRSRVPQLGHLMGLRPALRLVIPGKEIVASGRTAEQDEGHGHRARLGLRLGHHRPTCRLLGDRHVDLHLPDARIDSACTGAWLKGMLLSVGGGFEAERLGVDARWGLLNQDGLESRLVHGQTDLAVGAGSDHDALPLDVEVLDLTVRVSDLESEITHGALILPA